MHNPQQQRNTPGEKASHRRDFLKAAGAAGVAMMAASHTSAQVSATQPASGNGNSVIPMRPFGRHTDVKISALGLGGHHLGDLPTVEDAIKIVHEAIDGGVTFFDNCWEYHNGKSENWMGRAGG